MCYFSMLRMLLRKVTNGENIYSELPGQKSGLGVDSAQSMEQHLLLFTLYSILSDYVK